MQALVPTQTYYLTDADGNQVMQVPPGMIAQVQQMMSGNAGNGIANLGDGIDIGASVIEAMAIQDDIDDSRDSLARLYTARQRLYAGLKLALPNPVSAGGPTVAELVRNVDIQQDKVDRAQNRAFEKSITVLWAKVFGAGMRIAGRMQNGMANMWGGGGGGGGVSSLLAAAAGGFLFSRMFDRRDDRDRDEDDVSNVPPLS